MGHANAAELENLAGHYAECSAYFTLAYHAVNNSGGDTTAAEGFSEVSDNAMFYSLLLASENREQDMAINVTHSRIEMYLKLMKREINNDNANFSILMNKHSFPCQDAMNNLPIELLNIINRRISETQ